ncbi:MAG: hypothetical protein ACI4XA_02220 [Oscillospiraceae bacterium]
MTELDTLIRAESYIRKMANGINPITDEAAADDDMVNNVRITRCLYYVSDILRQVIDNNGVIEKKSRGSGKKADFYMTDEQRANFTVFERPVFLREFVDEINRLTETNNCKKFAARWIRAYFVSIGLLVADPELGSKYATEEGEKLGIIPELRQSKQSMREYWVNKYSPEAQHFIIDNIDTIVEFAKSPQYTQFTHPESTSSDSPAEY